MIYFTAQHGSISTAIVAIEALMSRLQPCDSVRNANSVVRVLCPTCASRVCSVNKHGFAPFIKFSRFNFSVTFHLHELRTLVEARVSS